MLKTMSYQYILALKCEKKDSSQIFFDAKTAKEIKIYAGGDFYYDGKLLGDYEILELLRAEVKEPYRFTIDLYS